MSPDRDTAGWSVHVALLVVQVSFASGAFAGKWALNGEGIDPSAIAFVRATGGAVAFHLARVLARRAVRRSAPALEVPRLRDHGRFLVLGFLGVVVNQAFFLHGLKRSSATAATLLAATIPVFTAAVAALAGVEALHAMTVVGVAVASAGVVGLTGVRDISVGNLLVTLNSLSYACYLVMARTTLRRFGAATTVAWVFTYGALALAVVGLHPLVSQAPHWTARGLVLVGWFLAVPTIVAYLLNAWALSHAKPSVVSGYIYLQPLLVAVLAWPLLGERLTLRIALAGACILIGVTLIGVRTWLRPRAS